VGIGLVVVFLAIQLVPYGRDHSNPPVTQDAAWPTAAARDLAVRACYDCHSNESRWPWYSNIAPISWLVQRDVVEGREKLNFSETNRVQEEGDEAAETIREGEMPPWFYTLPHPDARLNDREKQDLAAALTTMFGDEGDD
jgi:hypothetical protein